MHDNKKACQSQAFFQVMTLTYSPKFLEEKPEGTIWRWSQGYVPDYFVSAAPAAIGVNTSTASVNVRCSAGFNAPTPIT